MRIIPFLIIIFCVGFLSSAAKGQTGTDFGAPDTVRFDLTVDDAVENEVKLTGRLFFFNDAQKLAAVGVGLGWNSPNLRMDSASMTPVGENAFGADVILIKQGDITITNRDRQFLFFGTDLLRNGLAASSFAQHVATYWFTYSSAITAPVCIDTIQVGGVIHFEFVDTDLLSYVPNWNKNDCSVFLDDDSDTIIDLVDNCPGISNPDQLDDDGDGIGNVCDSILSPCGDADGSGDVTTSDLEFLIKYYFMFGDPPVSIIVADVNGDGLFDLSDIMYFAAYLNNNGLALCAGSEPPPSFDPKKEPKGRSTGPTGY